MYSISIQDTYSTMLKPCYCNNCQPSWTTAEQNICFVNYSAIFQPIFMWSQINLMRNCLFFGQNITCRDCFDKLCLFNVTICVQVYKPVAIPPRKPSLSRQATHACAYITGLKANYRPVVCNDNHHACKLVKDFTHTFSTTYCDKKAVFEKKLCGSVSIVIFIPYTCFIICYYS